MKQKYRIGDVLYYHGYIFVIKRTSSNDPAEYNYGMYRIESTGLSMWVSEIEIYNRCKLIEI